MKQHEIEKIHADIDKLMAETMKIQAETKWYQAIVGASGIMVAVMLGISCSLERIS